MLVMLGVSHHQVSLATLEQLAAEPTDLAAALAGLAQSPDSPIRGVVQLATCHRLELYLDATRFHDAVDAVSALLTPELADAMTVRVGTGVVTHLFAVAAGLESVVIGESEIAGQVARALDQAPGSSPELHRLFQQALQAARTVAAQTRIGAAGRSVATVALDAAAQRLGSLCDRSVLMIGTGAFARVVAGALRARGVTELTVLSPSGRAAAFARTHGARALDRSELPELLGTVDLVVTASGHGPVLDAAVVAAACAARSRELVMVDLALPHDLPAAVRQLTGVAVIDLDTVAGSAVAPANEERAAAERIITDAVERFESTSAERTADPVVIALRQHVLGAADSELDRLRRKYSDEVAADLQRSLHRVTHALLHQPTMRAKQLARDGSAEDYLSALHTVFGIDLRAQDSAEPER